ncbi:hypothetical protein ABK040_015933 [Willaertia magna]
MQQNINDNSYLFATDYDGMIACNEENYLTKWNEWKLPIKNNQIKQLVCGSTFIVIYSINNEFYWCGKSNLKQTTTKNINDFWHKLEINKNLINKPIKRIYANYSDLIIQLENNKLIINNEIENLKFKDCEIKFIECGPLSNHYIVVDKNEQLHYFLGKKLNTENVDTNEIKKPIKLIGCSNRSNIIVTIDNKMYGYGDNQFDVLAGLQKATNGFKYMSTPFEKESEIIDVKCGYFYTAVLLKNGVIYAVGNNSNGSCDPQSNAKTISHFIKLKCDLFNNEFFERITCSSRGVVLFTKSNYAYLIGEVVDTLQNYNDDTWNGIKSYKINISTTTTTIHKIKLNNKYNDIEAGGWHYVVYNNVNLRMRKSLIYFEKNLLSLTKKEKVDLEDIDIVIY